SLPDVHPGGCPRVAPVGVAARAVVAVSAELACAGILLAALSGVPGLALPREHPAGDRAGAILLGLAALCAAAASALAAAGMPDTEIALPWRVLGERIAVGVDGLSAFFLLPALGLPFLASVYASAYY